MRAVVGVIDGETLRLDDGNEVRLVGAMTPRAPLSASAAAVTAWQPSDTIGRAPSFDVSDATGADRATDVRSSPDIITPSAWPPAGAARRMLEELVLGRSIRLWRTDRRRPVRGIVLRDLPRDRYGRILAHVTTVGEGVENRASVWLQAALLRAGLARAYSTRDACGCVRRLLNHEAEARQARRGLWRHASYTIRPASNPAPLLDYMHTFQVVEGRVLRVGRYGKTTYINFGRRWKTDFTLIVEGRGHSIFRKAGIDLKTLEGRRVRVRGWIETQDGPMIRLTHPEQIERADRDRPEDGDGQDRDAAPSDHLASFDEWRERETRGLLDERGDRTSRGRRRPPEEFTTGFQDDNSETSDPASLDRQFSPRERRLGRARRGYERKPAPAAVKAKQAPDSEFLSM